MTASSVGNYTLALSVVAACGGIFAAICAGRFNSPAMLRAARRAVYAVAALLTISSITLLAAILDNNFRLDYVVRYTERALPLGYKLAAFWAGQEGSLLLWAWLVAVMASLAVAWGRQDREGGQGPAIGILSAVCGCFAIILLFAANPFTLSEFVPPDGQGMNPMLQDPAMIAHPPALFLGYAGCTVPFALVFGALIAGRTGGRWLARARQWVLASWLFLTVGIVLGAEWAYVELGWGGYWAWDPVENASLLPWFTATALMHSLILQQRRGTFKVWNALLAGLSFLLCLFGTFLTRSGVIASVHAYGKSQIGQVFLAVLGLFVVFCILVMIWRRRLLKSDRPMRTLLSVDGGFLAANVLLMVMMLTTLVGTIFPILSRLFSGSEVTLGPPFYNKVIVPMALALVALLGTGPFLAVATSAGKLRQRLIVPGAAAIVAAGATLALGAANAWMVLAAAISAFVVAAIFEDLVRAILRQTSDPRRSAPLAIIRMLRLNARRYGGQVVHLGMAMVVMGVAGSSLYSTRHKIEMGPGQSVEIGQYTLRMESLKGDVREATYQAGEARVTLLSPRGQLGLLRPQRRRYNKSRGVNTEVAVHRMLREDVYLVLNGWVDSGRITKFEVIISPLVNWIWIGSIVMTAGALLSLAVSRPPSARPREPQEAVDGQTVAADQPDAEQDAEPLEASL